MQRTQSIQMFVVLVVRFDIYCPFSATSNSHFIREDLPPPTASELPELPSSVGRHSEEVVVLYEGVPFITRTFSHAYPSRAAAMQIACTPYSSPFSRRRGEK